MHFCPRGFAQAYLLSLQVGVKRRAVRGWPSEQMKVNPATTPRQFKAKEELKSSPGRTVQANWAYGSLQNTLGVSGRLDAKSPPAPLVPIWEEGTLL